MVNSPLIRPYLFGVLGSFGGGTLDSHESSFLPAVPKRPLGVSCQNPTATYNGTLYGQYGEWVDDTGAGTYIDSDFHHNGHLKENKLKKNERTQL